ncbi:unnamed protein product [Durusdinium trenchii]|uniref:EamA domain-containing protein n=1 Tax=Durusdinium trenchii TaxID=1381693 RepID=A0ABP0IED9_9DINO
MAGRLEPSQVQIAACLASGQMLFGATAVVGRVGLRASNPLAFSIWRFLFAAPVLELVLAWHKGWSSAIPQPSRVLLLCAACLVGANLGMTLGVVLSGQVTATAWQPLQLVFTTFFSLILGLESASFQKMLGVALGMAGACIIVFLDPGMWENYMEMQSSGWGHLALLVNSLSSSSMVVLRRRLIVGSGLSAMQIMAWTHLLALPLLILLGLAGNQSVAFRAAACNGCESLTAPPTSSIGWMALAFYTVVPTMLCQSLMTWSAKHAEPTMIAMFSVLQPLASASLSWILRSVAPSLRDTLLPPQWNMLGGLPVMVGVWLVSRASAPPKAKTSPLKTKAS